MKYEIEAAAEFITKILYPNSSPATSPRSHYSISTPTLPTPPSAISPRKYAHNDRQEEEESRLFYRKMCKELGKKFVGHWYEDEPIKGQAYRCLLFDNENNFIDKVILSTAQKANIKNVEAKMKKSVGFQMWIDPGEVEVEYFPSAKTRKSNEILYSSSRRNSARTPTPPSPSSSPSLSSPPSSPVPSSYILSSPSPNSTLHYSSAPSLAHSIPLNNANFYRANKPIRISHRPNDEPVFFDKSYFPPADKDLHSTIDTSPPSVSHVKTALSFPQRAM